MRVRRGNCGGLEGGAGRTYEGAVVGSFGMRGPGEEGDASYQHGGRQWRNSLLGIRCLSVLEAHEMCIAANC